MTGSMPAGHPAVGHRLSITARVVLLSMGVALVAALLASVATARVLLAVQGSEARSVLQTIQTRRLAEGGSVLQDARELAHRPLVARSLLTSLGVGLLVGVTAGGSASYLLVRPLRRTADVARAMGAGRRDLRVAVAGPPEVADVAASLNDLADALQHSEDRQRAFLLSVSHELRTPLTAVRGFAESIADGVVTGPAAAEAGRVVLAESQRLERLVHDLLDLARLGAVDFRLDLDAVDLDRLVSAAALVWQARADERGVRFRLEAPAQALTVRTDPARLRQVIDGLSENALRVTPAGAAVVLALRGPTALDPAGTGAVLQVRDGGPGLTDADHAVAFEPGVLGERYRNDRPGGVGIGLSLVHGLVQRLGGQIDVGVAVEGGAAFTVQLPAAVG
jgi:signal transduction histidine kinase